MQPVPQLSAVNNVAIYLRISSDPDATHVGVDRQRVDCLTLARSRWPDAPTVEYADNDVTAYNPRVKRPGFLAMVEAIRARDIAYVVAYNMDRLLRQPRELEQLIDIGAVIVTVQGDLDLTTHDGQLQARILVAVAKKSSDDTSRRVKREARDRAEAGKFHGGAIPYGFLRGPTAGSLLIDERAADDIRQVAKQLVDGDLLGRVLRLRLERDAAAPGPHTHHGWSILLQSMTVRGRNRQGVVAEWPAILDPFTATRLTTILQPRARRPARNWPLSGVARCHECKGPLYGAQHEPGYRYPAYACATRGCGKVAISAKHLHAFVLAALDSAVITTQVPVERERDTRREQAMEHLAAEYAAGSISRREWEAARATLDVAKQVTQRTSYQQVVGGDGFEPRLSLAVDHIMIHRSTTRGRVIDTDRIKIKWHE